MKLAKIVKACRIDKPGRFRLADHDPAETFGLSTEADNVKPIPPTASGGSPKCSSGSTPTGAGPC
jgi:hypothetical protein